MAITVTEYVCRKDFSFNPDEAQLRRSAHQMMRAMTAGMAVGVCLLAAKIHGLYVVIIGDFLS